MTTPTPELMPDVLDDDMPAKIWVVPSDEKTGEYDVNRFCECLDCQLCRTSQRYVHTDLYTAAIAERDALRDFQAEIVRVYFDPTISEIETQAAIHRMMTEAKDRVRQHEKHKAGE